MDVKERPFLSPFISLSLYIYIYVLFWCFLYVWCYAVVFRLPILIMHHKLRCSGPQSYAITIFKIWAYALATYRRSMASMQRNGFLFRQGKIEAGDHNNTASSSSSSNDIQEMLSLYTRSIRHCYNEKGEKWGAWRNKIPIDEPRHDKLKRRKNNSSHEIIKPQKAILLFSFFYGAVVGMISP